jgi:hypothetical protein
MAQTSQSGASQPVASRPKSYHLKRNAVCRFRPSPGCQLSSQRCSVTLDRLHLVRDRASREIWSRIAARVFPFLNFDVRWTLANLKRSQHDLEKLLENLISLIYYFWIITSFWYMQIWFRAGQSGQTRGRERPVRHSLDEEHSETWSSRKCPSLTSKGFDVPK